VSRTGALRDRARASPHGLRARVNSTFFESSFPVPMRRARLVSLFAALPLVLSAPAALAMGFGRTASATTLGQRLDFAADLALDGDETLERRCVRAAVEIGDAKVAPDNLRVTLENGSGNSARRVRVTSRVAVDEPVVNVEITVGCTSQMSRRFVVFVDPPALRLAQTTSEQPLAPQRVETQVAPLLDIVRAADASQRRAASQSGAHPVAAAALSRRTARTFAPGRAPGPRLRLESATALAAPAAAASAPTPAADAVRADSIAALAAERAQLQQLEVGLARLRQESQAQQKTVAALQARLREAEGGRYANGLVYVLAAGVLFFALLSAAFWALRPRQRRRARWFQEQTRQQRGVNGTPSATTSEGAASPDARQPAISQHPSQWEQPSAHGALPLTAPATIGGLEVTTVLAPESHCARLAGARVPANGAPAATLRTGSPWMEALIDLEQQTEFFIVIGQEEEAIALLDTHLRENGGASPLPFLQLLEIHQRRGDRASYEKVRQGYRRCFDAFAPEWSADLHFGRALDEYPIVLARLQALWPTPLYAMQTLDGLLFRRSENDDAFDFPVYRDLLFLCAIARDLAGHVDGEAASIDLLLPLDGPVTATGIDRDFGAAVDLDVSGWPDDLAAEAEAIHRPLARRAAR
jgi:pilus assembly protein FimV